MLRNTIPDRERLGRRLRRPFFQRGDETDVVLERDAPMITAGCLAAKVYRTPQGLAFLFILHQSKSWVEIGTVVGGWIGRAGSERVWYGLPNRTEGVQGVDRMTVDDRLLPEAWLE
jgi:hypothetical protein